MIPAATVTAAPQRQLWQFETPVIARPGQMSILVALILALIAFAVFVALDLSPPKCGLVSPG